VMARCPTASQAKALEAEMHAARRAGMVRVMQQG
jgi:hypothetical protein